MWKFFDNIDIDKKLIFNKITIVYKNFGWISISKKKGLKEKNNYNNKNN
jgi:hypothetical protein